MVAWKCVYSNSIIVKPFKINSYKISLWIPRWNLDNQKRSLWFSTINISHGKWFLQFSEYFGIISAIYLRYSSKNRSNVSKGKILPKGERVSNSMTAKWKLLVNNRPYVGLFTESIHLEHFNNFRKNAYSLWILTSNEGFIWKNTPKNENY